MTKKFCFALGCVALLTFLSSFAMADAITFTFTDTVPVTLTAGPTGTMSFSTDNKVTIVVTDQNTPLTLTLASKNSSVVETSNNNTLFSATGAGAGAMIFANYSGGNSIQIEIDSKACNNGTLKGVCLQGTYNFLEYVGTKGDGGGGGGVYNVTYVSPYITSYFGDPNAWMPTGGNAFQTNDNKWMTKTPTSETSTLAGGTISFQTPIPEPGTLALFGTGILGLAGVIRRKLQ